MDRNPSLKANTRSFAASQISSNFMEYGGSLLCSQQPATCPCLVPDKSNPDLHIFFFQISFNIILPSKIRSSKPPLSSFPHQYAVWIPVLSSSPHQYAVWIPVLSSSPHQYAVWIPVLSSFPHQYAVWIPLLSLSCPLSRLFSLPPWPYYAHAIWWEIIITKFTFDHWRRDHRAVPKRRAPVIHWCSAKSQNNGQLHCAAAQAP